MSFSVQSPGARKGRRRLGYKLLGLSAFAAVSAAAAVPASPIGEAAGSDRVRFRGEDYRFGYGTTRDQTSRARVEAVVVPAVYDWASDFQEDSASVRQNGRWGLIDPSGKPIVPLQFDYVQRCERGFARVFLAGKVGLWDCKRRAQYVAPKYLGLTLPSTAGLVGASETGPWGVIKPDGTAVSPFANLVLNHQPEGHSVVFNGGKWTVIGLDGSQMFGRDTGVTAVEGGRFVFPDETAAGGRYGLMTAARQVLIPPVYKSMRCDDGVCVARGDAGMVSFDAKTGAPLVSKPYAWLSFANGRHVAADDRRAGPFYYLDRTGQPLFGRSFDRALPFDAHGLAKVMKGGKWGVIHTAGKLVLPLELEVAEGSGYGPQIEITDRYIRAVKGGYWGVADHTGRILLPFQYRSPMAAENDNPFDDFQNKPTVLRDSAGRMGVLAADASWILPPGQYDQIGVVTSRLSNRSWIVEVAKAGRWGVYDLTARRELVPTTYAQISANEEYMLFSGPDGRFTRGLVYDTGEQVSVSGVDLFSYAPEARVWTVVKSGAETDLFGLVDAGGKALTPVVYTGDRGRYPGLSYDLESGLFFADRSGRTGFLRPDGQPAIPLNYESMAPKSPFHRMLIGFEEGAVDLPQGGQLVLIGRNGQAIVRSQDFGLRTASRIRTMRFGAAPAYVATFARSDGKGVHERLIFKGKLYEAAGGSLGAEEIRAEFKEGLMPVRVNGKFGYIDTMGDLVIPPTFDDAGPFIDGAATVRIGTQWGSTNRLGQTMKLATARTAIQMRSAQKD